MTKHTRTYGWDDPVGHTRDGGAGMTGLEFLEAIVAGEIPQPPIGQTMNFSLAEVGEGQAVFVSEPGTFLHNPMGTMHGGYYATLLDSCLSCAVHSTLEADAGYTTLEFKVHLVRGLKPGEGPVRAEGQVIHRGRSTATAEGRIVDRNGRLYAHGTGTCMIFPARN